MANAPSIPLARSPVAPSVALGGLFTVYIVVFLLPIEFAVSFGSVFLPPTRLLFLVLVIPLLIVLLRHPGKIWIDYLILAYAGWVMLAHFAKRGAGGIEPAGQAMVEIIVPYLMARLFLTSTGQLQRFYAVMAVAIGLLGILAIPEAVLGTRYLHNIPSSITGVVYEMQADTRLGMLRAASTFENPILFGMYSATFLSLLWFATNGAVGLRLLAVAAITLATFMSLSSAPLLMLLMQFVFIAAERLSRPFKSRVKIGLMITVAIVIFLEVFSDRGTARLIASYLTFNPATGYYRLLQWDFSIDDVMANPMFGILFENWTRPFWLTDSIDNQWLFLAMVSGVPAVLMIWTAIGGLIFKLYKRRKQSENTTLNHLILGWILGMIALYLGGWTVAFFGKMLPSLFFFIGIGAALLVMPDSTQKTGPANRPGAKAEGGSEDGTDDANTAPDAPLPVGSRSPYSRF